MANELVPQPGRHPSSDDGKNGAGSSGSSHIPAEGKIFDPLVAMEFVDTDSQTAGMRDWNLPPEESPWEGFEAARDARRSAAKADADAAWGRKHGLLGYAAMRETDAADDRQSNWDWGDLKTWLILLAMFFGFLIFSLIVYWMPEGRFNQGNPSHSMPDIHVYLCLKEICGL
jgi:hypothetical protein